MGNKTEEVAPGSTKMEQAALNSPQMEQVEPHQLKLHHKLIQDSIDRTTSPDKSSCQELSDETSGEPSAPEVLVDTLKEPSIEFTEHHNCRAVHQGHCMKQPRKYLWYNLCWEISHSLHRHCSCRDCANFGCLKGRVNFQISCTV